MATYWATVIQNKPPNASKNSLVEFPTKHLAYFDIMWPNWPINTHFCQGFSNWVVSWGLFRMWNSLAVDPWKQRDFDNWLIVSLVPVTLCFVARSGLLLPTNITYKNCRVLRIIIGCNAQWSTGIISVLVRKIMGYVPHTGRNKSCCDTTELCKSCPCDFILCGAFLAAVTD